MDSIPAEIAAIIACGAPAVLHTCRRFAAILQCQHARYDIMIAAGYTIAVSKSCITWYRHGLVHRVSGPAHEYPGVCTVWYRNGERHREDGPAYISHSTTVWSTEELGGQVHFTMYPPCPQIWYYRGKLHRLDGPAVIDGANTYYYIDGKKYDIVGHAFASLAWMLWEKLNLYL